MAKSSSALHAVDYLAHPKDYPPRPVCAAFGDEAFLKRQVLTRLREAVLGGGEGDFSFSSFDGTEAEWRDVLDELSTLAMFGGGKRLVMVEEADEFITRYRTQLEDYVARPKSNAIFVLETNSWPGNTKLVKAVAASGLAIDCSVPSGRGQTKWLTDWLGAWAKQAHHAQLAPTAADMLVEMVGPELGLLDQELAKLALAAGAGGKITPELVTQMVGSWRAKTAWDMLDAALDGDVGRALVEMDRLLLAGENPIGVLAQIAGSLRRFAAATRMVLAAEAAGRRTTPREALQQAGVNNYFVEKTERQLRRVGRHRGEKLYDWLLEADLDLKGDSPLPPRTILEQLLVRVAAPATPAKGT